MAQTLDRATYIRPTLAKLIERHQKAWNRAADPVALADAQSKLLKEIDKAENENKAQVSAYTAEPSDPGKLVSVETLTNELRARTRLEKLPERFEKKAEQERMVIGYLGRQAEGYKPTTSNPRLEKAVNRIMNLRRAGLLDAKQFSIALKAIHLQATTPGFQDEQIVQDEEKSAE